MSTRRALGWSKQPRGNVGSLNVGGALRGRQGRGQPENQPIGSTSRVAPPPPLPARAGARPSPPHHTSGPAGAQGSGVCAHRHRPLPLHRPALRPTAAARLRRDLGPSPRLGVVGRAGPCPLHRRPSTRVESCRYGVEWAGAPGKGGKSRRRTRFGAGDMGRGMCVCALSRQVISLRPSSRRGRVLGSLLGRAEQGVSKLHR